MRNFFNGSAALLALLVLSSAVYAQTAVVAQTVDANSYYFPNFVAYKAGFAYSADAAALQGQVFKSLGSAAYEPYAGLDLTLDGGADFTLTTKTDENGVFSFDGVPAGTYTLFAQNATAATFGSVAVTLSKSDAKTLLSDNSTIFNVASMKLLFDNELFILGEKRPAVAEEEVIVDEESCCSMAADGAACGASACCGGSGVGGGMFGGSGMLAAALGAAGLASGLASLADDSSGDDNSDPVSVGAP